MVAQGIAPDLITCNTLINGYTKSRDLDLAIQILEVITQQSTLSPDVYTLRPVLDLCVSMGGHRLDGVLEVLQARLEACTGSNGGGGRYHQGDHRVNDVAAMYSALIDACMMTENAKSRGLAGRAIASLEAKGLGYRSQIGYSAVQVKNQADKVSYMAP